VDNMVDKDIPINVIVLEDIEIQTADFIDSYVSIIKTCTKTSQVRSAVELICDEIRTLTLREILVKRIQQDAEVLRTTAKMK
jgi:hypothetical protein